MANENIKDFTMQWIMFGLLFFCMITFAITFVAYNNPISLGDGQGIFESSQNSSLNRLVSVQNSSDLLLNITSETNPEISDLGSRDSVATAYGTAGVGKGFFTSARVFFGWVLTGTAGQILISVFIGMIGLISLYWITKAIRNGL